MVRTAHGKSLDVMAALLILEDEREECVMHVSTIFWVIVALVLIGVGQFLKSSSPRMRHKLRLIADGLLLIIGGLLFLVWCALFLAILVGGLFMADRLVFSVQGFLMMIAVWAVWYLGWKIILVSLKFGWNDINKAPRWAPIVSPAAPVSHPPPASPRWPDEKCEKCGKVISGNDMPSVWKQRVVCHECHDLLKKAQQWKKTEIEEP